jgi:hypothetical protein
MTRVDGVHRENAMIEIPVSKDIQSMGELSATNDY